MRSFVTLSLVVLLVVGGNHTANSQSNQVPLSFDDARQWRTHSVTLSDDGQWYTTLYSLFDEPDKKDTAKDSAAEKVKAYYSEDNQTDVLYISNARGQVKYKIPKGSDPIFSEESDWIAYRITEENESDKEGEDSDDKTFIELRHLESGFSVKYEANVSYEFLEDSNYFVTSDDDNILVYDLDNRREHYIANIGEYLVDEKSTSIAYTITSEDKRGNGIYLYDPAKMTTKALQTGSFIYSNLAWNNERNALAAYKYNKVEDKIDYSNMKVVLISGIDTDTYLIREHLVSEMEGMPENMGPAVKSGRFSNAMTWSNDGARLFIKIKEYGEEEKEDLVHEDGKEGSSVQVWHWKDKKLLSERIMESENTTNKVFDAVFFPGSNRLIQLTSDELQRLIRSRGTDKWAIGTDNREYISDWDINKDDLYRVNLVTGEKKLIHKQYDSGWRISVQISPDGESAILWDSGHFWHYDFAKDSKCNISEALNVSFVNTEYDLYGQTPSYGFVGWVKGQNAVIVNHKHDLWLLPLDDSSKAENLTSSVTVRDSIQFRFEDYSFRFEERIEDRYIDLSSQNFLYAFNTQNKEAGYYHLQNGKLKELIYGPSGYADPYRGYGIIKSEKSDVIIFKKGDYQNYPEAYLTKRNFSRPRKITNTNPQQEMYHWGKRVLINYTNDDGVPLQGILSLPDGYKEGDKLPMIVYSYEKLSSGMYSYAIPYLNGATVPEMLYVSQGYLFLRPDIHFNVGTPHSDMHESIDAAIEEVIELGYVDEKRIGYEGFSFGGHCGMYMSTQKNRFAAIAAGAGVSNLVQGFNIDIVRDGSNEQDYYMTGQGRLAEDPTANTQMYISESPVFNAATMDTPLLLFHGTADNVVQWEHSFGFYSILRYLKKPVVFLSYLGEGHGLRKESNRLDIQIRLKDYFDHYLKGAEIKKWMTEELPYVPNKEEGKRTLPKWK